MLAQPNPVLRVAAPAKINLYLHVLARRPDGYHELDSLVAFADIGDLVTARSGTGLSLAIDGPFASALSGDGAENLIMRAAWLLAQHTGIVPNAALTLTKNLPVASGIGGGSSDAAAALRALCRLWDLQLSHSRLAGLAAVLGADVPVCLFGRSAWLGGVGEQILPAPLLPALGIVLVNPAVALPTPAVFKARQGPFSAAARFVDRPKNASEFLALLRQRRNDLTEAATMIVPEIAEVLHRLETTDGVRLARMSGSGATCFALYDSREAAERVVASLRAARPGWWIAAGMLPWDPSPVF